MQQRERCLRSDGVATLELPPSQVQGMAHRSGVETGRGTSERTVLPRQAILPTGVPRTHSILRTILVADLRWLEVVFSGREDDEVHRLAVADHPPRVTPRINGCDDGSSSTVGEGSAGDGKPVEVLHELEGPRRDRCQEQTDPIRRIQPGPRLV
ncbi:MAG: hypothetical protein JW751_03300 [Polyangiaceae bacterium]|nr:hypothetical protein [Polyangiaceae bacterium]